MERRMSRLPLALLFAALASPAQAQTIGRAPAALHQAPFASPATVRQHIMSMMRTPLHCPMPVVRGTPGDSMPVTKPSKRRAPADPPVPMPTARGNCRNTLDTRP
jgi:hypothetical protein